MENLLDIKSPIVFDESVAHWEIHTHQPFATSTYNNNDEIHIVIQHQDQCLLPCRSSLHIQGKATQENAVALKAGTILISNAICYLFSQICYELNAIEIEKNNNVGTTSSMMDYPSLNSKFSNFSG